MTSAKMLRFLTRSFPLCHVILALIYSINCMKAILHLNLTVHILIFCFQRTPRRFTIAELLRKELGSVSRVPLPHAHPPSVLRPRRPPPMPTLRKAEAATVACCNSPCCFLNMFSARDGGEECGQLSAVHYVLSVLIQFLPEYLPPNKTHLHVEHDCPYFFDNSPILR